MRRILFHVEPLVMHGRPFHYWAWLARAAAMARQLADSGWEPRIALNAALATRAVAPHDPSRPSDPANGQGLPRERLAVFQQNELRAPYRVPNLEILSGLHRDTWPAATVAAHARVLRERLAGWTPDVIVTWTPSRALRAAWPEALILHSEYGMFSRAPYPAFQFFDPQGLYEQSVPGSAAAELLARRPSADEQTFLDGWRARLLDQHRATTPFAGLERGLRERFARLVLLPLQFGGEPGFDLNAPYRQQGEYLIEVLERMPADAGVIVNEHPTAVWLGDRIDEETRGWLARACPQATFVPLAAGLHAGQTLVPHVDSVVNVSSSIGWQALFWGRELAALGGGHLAPYAHVHDVAAIGSAPRPPATRDGALAWLLTHYFVRDARWLHDREWLVAFLERSLARWQSGVRGLAFFAPTEPLARLAHDVLELAAPSPPAPTVEGDIVVNGAFAATRGAMPRGWQFVEIGGTTAAADVTAGEPPGRNAMRIRRRPGGSGPALLLQRIPDARRLAGAAVSVTFEARAEQPARVECYLYVQPGPGGSPPRGTPPQGFDVTTEWRRFTCRATVPALGPNEPLGVGNHTELVIAVPPSPTPVAVEVTGVSLGPADWLAAA